MNKHRETDEKRMLKNSDQRFWHIFEHSPAMVYVTDLNGIMLDINEAGEKYLVMSHGKKFSDLRRHKPFM